MPARRLFIPAVALALCAAGCERKTPAPTATSPSAPTQSATITSEGAPAPAAKASVKGVVKETMDAGGYTYLRLDTGHGDEWAAVNAAKIAVGSQVTIAGASPMNGFHSKTLNRTFDKIWFGHLGGAPAKGAPGSQPAGGGPVKAGAEAKGHAPPPSAGVTLKAPMPAGVKTVAQLWASRATLAGKPTRVHGKVVKFTAQIMGKNWVHVQDGSGDAAQGTHDLTVTTDAMLQVGDEVTLEGTAALDKDFGGGYQYKLILESGRIILAP